MAECSLSTGIIGERFSKACCITISPATTSVSLFASAITLPFFTPFNVDFKPAKPTIAVSITSYVSKSATSSNAFSPANTFISVDERAFFTVSYFVSSPITTAFGKNSSACFISNSAFVCAVNISASNKSEWVRITSRACVPIEPVDPKIATRFFCPASAIYSVIIKCKSKAAI